MKDRLLELRSIQSDLPPEYEETAIDVEAHKKNPFLDDFFSQIDDIQQNIREIQETVQAIKKKHSQILSAPQPDDRVKEELEKLMVEVKRRADMVKVCLKSNDLQKFMMSLTLHDQSTLNDGRIDDMQKSIKEQDTVDRGKNADARIKKSQHSTLSREFVEVMTEYNDIQNKYREKCKERIKRQLHIAGGDPVEDEQLEEMIESGNLQIFTQGIITETQQAKQSLREIEARHNDIIKLETSIKELHEMFTDMALLVQSQGEMVDRIEYNVANAADFVGVAAATMQKAVHYQSKSRKKKIIIIICCLVLALIIALAIYFSVKSSQKNT